MVGFTGVVILRVGGADLGNRRGYPPTRPAGRLSL